MSDQILLFDRAEDLLLEDVPKYFRRTAYDQELLGKLKDQTTYLLDGCRGSGKTMLMRMAEYELDWDFRHGGTVLGVFIRFPRAIALEGTETSIDHEYHPFRQWVFAKILKATIEKLNQLGRTTSQFTLRTMDGSGTVTATQLATYIDRLETTYKDPSALSLSANAEAVGVSPDLLRRVDKPDVMKDQFLKLVSDFGLTRIVFFLDEVAQNLTEDLQAEFFSIVKHLRDARLTCKVAVFPHITSYGRDFEVGHDAVVASVERPVEDDDYLDFFKQILLARVEETPLATALVEQDQYLTLMVKAAFGNPRALIHILARLPIKTNLQFYEVLNSIKDYVDQEHLKYLRNLKARLRRSRPVISLAEDLLNQFVEDLRKLNTKPGPRYLFVAVSSQKAVPYRIHRAIDILVYAGLLAKRSTVKISSRESAIRYLVNFGVLVKENAVADPSGGRSNLGPQDYIDRLSNPDRDRKKEYTKNSQDLFQLNRRSEEDEDLTCPSCSASVHAEDKFCSDCGTKLQRPSLYAELLSHPITNLDLTPGVLKRLQEFSPLRTVGDIIASTDEELDEIPLIGAYRVRVIRYAAEEYISG